ncbi:hypothetical protein [Mesorhizobium salmacidum]|uniref:hypothetical protein n=1 Tax=Mesorhizobium salmacidum TaxID=3015171 RepID=UPI0039F6385E
MQIIFDHDDVTVRDVPPTPVVIIERVAGTGDARRHLHAVHGLAQSEWFVAADKPYFH